MRWVLGIWVGNATSIWVWWLPPQTVAVPKDRSDKRQLATAVQAVPHVWIEVVLEYPGRSRETALPPMVSYSFWPNAGFGTQPVT